MLSVYMSITIRISVYSVFECPILRSPLYYFESQIPCRQVEDADKLVSKIFGILEALRVEADLSNDFVVRF